MPQDLESSKVPSPSRPQTEPLRWRPDRSELEILRSHFKATKYPSIQEKQQILNELNKISRTTIHLSQLNNWFQKRRMREAEENEDKSKITRIYEKFSKGDLEYLTMAFEENMYPRLEEMVETAQFLGVKFNKVQNWYKQMRRLRAKEGQLSLQERRYFEKEQLDYIQDKFNTNCLPTKKELEEMAEHLECDVAQVRNWFANNRKKFRVEKQTEKTTYSSDYSTFREPEISLAVEHEQFCKLEAYSQSSSEKAPYKENSEDSPICKIEERVNLSRSSYYEENTQLYASNIAPLCYPSHTNYYTPSYQVEAPIQINHQISTITVNNVLKSPFLLLPNNNLSPYPHSLQYPQQVAYPQVKMVYVEVPYEVRPTADRANFFKSSEPQNFLQGNLLNSQYISNFQQRMPLM